MKRRFDPADYPPIIDDDTALVMEAERELLRFDCDAPMSDAGEESAIAAGEDQVEAVGIAVGIVYREDEVLDCGLKESRRDLRRWELDPASAEDYLDRMRERRRPHPH